MRFALLTVALAGCLVDDYDPNYTPSVGDTATIAESGIAGDWVSEGSDLSELFASEPFYYVRVDAHFDADGSYEVVVTDRDNAQATLTGTYDVGLGSDPKTIALTQAEPYASFAEGIWQIGEDGALTYEVVQTVPDYGYTPATPETGFGSTSGPSLAPGANVQVYR
ncbi:MAG: hypothetical protein EP330_06950 [Deltaproteobacteria bacterium]|nr:MAG: hypothetical protein EP330_06950 [Deltaproteobacteria bacterium]